ncbi:uncharacterized protein VTP21DRAFT_7107 [Calcarisporiella thermophila]|uniref:uncharacterized protein n=1 Tax=Calcarisporiella thermophila TaxID=911321 RepID=UPI0037442DD9
MSSSLKSSRELYYNDGPHIRLSPSEFVFYPTKNASGYVSKMLVKNVGDTFVGLKFKTNAVRRYSVKPVVVGIMPMKSVQIYVRCDSNVCKGDKFLIQAVCLTREETENFGDADWRQVVERRQVVENVVDCWLADINLRETPVEASSVEVKKSWFSLSWLVNARYTSMQLLTVSLTFILIGLLIPIEKFIPL